MQKIARSELLVCDRCGAEEVILGMVPGFPGWLCVICRYVCARHPELCRR
jgi:hypothetical protein